MYLKRRYTEFGIMINKNNLTFNGITMEFIGYDKKKKMFVQEFQPNLMTDISILRNILLIVVVRKINAAAKHRKRMEGFFFLFSLS